MPAIGAAHRNGDVAGAGRPRLQIPLAENAEPPAIVAIAIGPGRTVVRADRQMDTLSRGEQFLGDLYARRSRADNEDRSLRQLIRTMVGGRMDLLKTFALGDE